MKLLRVIGSAYLLLLVIAWLTESTGLWGVIHLAHIPPSVAWTLCVLSLILLWIPATAMEPIVTAISKVLRKPYRAYVFVLVFILMIALFVTGRSQNHLLGDGYTVLSNTVDPEILVPTEVLDILSHRLVASVVGDAEMSFLVLSILSGILFVAVAGMLVFRLFKTAHERAGVMVLFLSLAQMQFFFGYAENYTMMTAVLCLFLYLGWRCALGQKSIWLVLLAFVVSGLFHVSAWFLLPGMLYLLWYRGSEDNKPVYRVLTFAIACLALVAATFYYANYRGDQIFVPFIAEESNPYSFFSFQHMSDVANLLLLAAPLPLFVAAYALARKITTGILLSPKIMFVALCLGGALLFTVYVDPKLGAARDWDLLSLCGVPAAFLAAVLFAEVFRLRRQAVTLLLVGLAVIAAHTAPWILSNTDPHNSLDYLKSVIRSDVHYTPDYHQGQRLMSWGKILADYFGDLEEKQRSYGLRVRGAPDDQRAWLTYAVVNYELGKNRLSAQALTHVRDLARLDDYQVENLARLQLQHGDTGSAKRSLEYFSEHHAESFNYLFLSGLAHQFERDLITASLYYERAMVFNSNDVDLLLNYATVRMNNADYSFAANLLGKAESLPDLTDRDRADVASLREILTSFMIEAEDSTKTP